MKSNETGADAFSDLEVGDLNKYDKRNADEIQRERARTLDERIAAFLALERNIEWAKDAPDFCASVEPECRELAGLSELATRLPAIREEARLLIARHEREILEANERAERLAAEEAERQRAKNREKAAEMTELISRLDSANPSKIWCENLEVTINEVRTLPREITLLIENLDLLDALAERSKAFLAAIEADERLRELKDAPHSEKWANEVKDFCRSVSKRILPYMTEGNLLSSLPGEAEDYLDRLEEEKRNAELRPIIARAEEYQAMLLDFESGKATALPDFSYIGLNYKQQLFLSKVTDYLHASTDFFPRYEAAKARLEKKSAEESAKKREEEAALARADKKRACIRNASISVAVIVPILLCIILGGKSEALLGVGLALAAMLIPYFVLPLCFGKSIHKKAYFVVCEIILKVAIFVLAIAVSVNEADIGVWLLAAVAASGLEVLLARAVGAINGFEFRLTHDVYYGTMYGRIIEEEPISAHLWIKIAFSVVGGIAFIVCLTSL